LDFRPPTTVAREHGSMQQYHPEDDLLAYTAQSVGRPGSPRRRGFQEPAQNITAVLSLPDEEGRGDGGIKSERAADRVGLSFENVPVKDFKNADLPLRLPQCVAALVHLSAAHCVRSLHCRCQPFAQCSCSLSPLVFRMGPRPGPGSCHAVPTVLPD